MLRDILRLGGRLCIITVVVTLALAATNHLTEDQITHNNNQKEVQARLEVIDADSFHQLTKTTFLARKSGKDCGYCVNVTSDGYGGEIKMVVGIDTEGAVTGVKIISHSETVGLGSRVNTPTFLDQFKGKDSVALGIDIDAISGATKSSRAVTNGVNEALTFINSVLKGD